MTRPEFIHLHLRSQFSILESMVRLEPLMSRLKDLQMPAVALTDKGNLFGAIPFYQSAISHGLKPILGCELWVNALPAGRSVHSVTFHPLVVLAQDEEGYQNIMKLSSLGYLRGKGLVPAVEADILFEHHQGLIILSGGPRGEIGQLLLQGNETEALKKAFQYMEIFGIERFFLEIQDHGLAEEKKILEGSLKIARKTGLRSVATNDVQYLLPNEAKYHEALLCLGRGETFTEKEELRLPDQYYLKSAEEMAVLFAEIPESLKTTLEIAERCHVILEFGKTYMPAFKVPVLGLDEDEYLGKLCKEAVTERFGPKAQDAEVMGRMNEELSIIRKTGFSGYFLIVHDFIAAAKAKGIPVGPGRGSAAGSLVSYLLGITDIDPIRHDLLFERFINPERVSAPDIDVDVCDRRRHEVLEYIQQTYGADRVASIVTFGTMAAKAVVRDVGRVMGIPLPEVDRIAKLIPGEPKISLMDAFERVPELREVVQEAGPYRQLWDFSKALEGLIRHVSTHAAGLLIGNKPLLESVPLCLGTGGEVLTQYDMNALKEVGLLKLDVLGLRTLSVMDDCLKWVEKTRGITMRLEDIPLEDEETFKLLRQAKTMGVFQLESRGMRDYLRKLEPSSIEDLTALNALYRPGPLGSDMVDDFIHRKKGLVRSEYLHPKLEPILKNTYGVILYQEQVMRIAKDLAGFSLGQADLLRRAMGSKNPEKMEQMRGKFLAGSKEREIPPDKAEAIFNQMAKFAGYGFNKSHSAAYALVAYQTAYLKAHYAREFMAAWMTSEIGNQNQISHAVFECKKFGIRILPPDVNESSDEFMVTPSGEVRFALSAIKNVGAPAVEAILKAQKNGEKFVSLADFCNRTKMNAFNPKMLECLIAAGAFDFTGLSRAILKASVPKVLRKAQMEQADQLTGQTSLFGGASSGPAEFAEPVPEESPAKVLMAEKEVLGFYLSGHPLSEHEWELEHYATPLHEIEDLPDGVEVRLAGSIRSLSRGISKKDKETYARLTLEDLHSHVEATVWPEIYKKAANLLVKDRLVALRGRLARNGNQVQVIAQEIIDIHEMASKWAKSIQLKINVIGLDDSPLAKVKTLCQDHPGATKVLFWMHTAHRGWMVVEASEELRIKPDRKFLETLEDLLGEDAVEIEI